MKTKGFRFYKNKLGPEVVSLAFTYVKTCNFSGLPYVTYQYALTLFKWTFVVAYRKFIPIEGINS